MERIGVDVGGSAIKVGVVDDDGRIVAERAHPLGEIAEARLLFSTVAAAVDEIDGGDRGAGIGVGLPAMMDADRTGVRHSPNLPWLAGVRPRAELAAALGIEPDLVRVENDANAAALGERWLGSARGEDDFLFLTRGTGVGSGLVLGGRLRTGAGFACEAGHLCVDPGGLRCGCGARGCIETLASATAVRRRALERGLPREDPGQLEVLADRARTADGPERKLLFQVGCDLGHALAAVVVVLDLSTFVFGGGFSAALDTMEGGIRQGLGEWAPAADVSRLSIRRASLGPSAGWIGAARLFLP